MEQDLLAFVEESHDSYPLSYVEIIKSNRRNAARVRDDILKDTKSYILQIYNDFNIKLDGYRKVGCAVPKLSKIRKIHEILEVDVEIFTRECLVSIEAIVECDNNCLYRMEFLRDITSLRGNKMSVVDVRRERIYCHRRLYKLFYKLFIF